VNNSCAVVLDIGKTNAKLTLWDETGACLETRVRRNEVVRAEQEYLALDVQGIDGWLAQTLSEFSRRAHIGAIVPVAHGAAAALLSQNRLFAHPMDYEDEPVRDERTEYDSLRDPFRHSGSPSLPQGLNLGFQLFRLERLTGPWPEDLRILPWPQYWAWRLSGVMASEVTSLGCHSDLWRPMERRFSDLAQCRGWANRFPPLRYAGDRLGTVTQEWVSRAGLAEDCVVLCGLHDSNSALVAARGHAEIAAGDATVLSTGTWFVAMRSTAAESAPGTQGLAEERDCLINADVHGMPVASARLMGGREAELLSAPDDNAVTEHFDAQRQIARLPDLLKSGAAALPSFVSGCGPFPHAVGSWRNRPADPAGLRSVIGLYLALMSDASLSLIESRDQLVIGGRFAEDPIYVGALAALRPQQRVFVSQSQDDVSFGALRLVHPHVSPRSRLTRIEPIRVDLQAFAEEWRLHSLGTRHNP
jgi:sugar (pentulose or hexulose) kinase